MNPSSKKISDKREAPTLEEIIGFILKKICLRKIKRGPFLFC